LRAALPKFFESTRFKLFYQILRRGLACLDHPAHPFNHRHEVTPETLFEDRELDFLFGFKQVENAPLTVPGLPMRLIGDTVKLLHAFIDRLRAETLVFHHFAQPAEGFLSALCEIARRLFLLALDSCNPRCLFLREAKLSRHEHHADGPDEPLHVLPAEPALHIIRHEQCSARPVTTRGMHAHPFPPQSLFAR
jgi:hypothetical protein